MFLACNADNLTDFDLRTLIEAHEAGGVAATLTVFRSNRPSAGGVVELDETRRVVGFVEKPEDPPTTLCATATYLYERDHLRLVERYLEEGNPPDQPGNYVAWLHEREPVYAYRFAGQWYDIGDAKQLVEADNRMRRRRGLPERSEYSPS